MMIPHDLRIYSSFLRLVMDPQHASVLLSVTAGFHCNYPDAQAVFFLYTPTPDAGVSFPH